MGDNRFYELGNDVNKVFEKLSKACEIEEHSNINTRIRRLVTLYEKHDKHMQTQMTDISDKLNTMKDILENEKKALDDTAIEEESVKMKSLAAKDQLDIIRQRQLDSRRILEEKKTHNKELLELCSELEKKDKLSMKYKAQTALYTNITGIRWAYDSEPDEVKGIIKKGKEFKSFSLNRKDCSQFFIVNYLWDQIGS